MRSVWLAQRELFPTKIVCVGRNYVEHVHELENVVPEEPVLFIKPNSAISHTIAPPPASGFHYEGEICFLFLDGKPVGVAPGLDLTNRTLQTQLKQKGLPWEKAKAFDGAAVLGTFRPFSGNFADLRMELERNGELVQQGSVRQMIFPPERLFQEIRRYFTLEDGDIVMTGTPAGVGEYQPGDVFRGRIFLANRLVSEEVWKVEI